MKPLICKLILLLIILTGCKTAVSPPAPLPTPIETAVITTTLPPPTSPPPLPTIVSQPTPTITPTPLPTATTAPTLHIAAPPELETAVSETISNSQHKWQLISSANPLDLLTTGQVDVALAWNIEGTLIKQDPIALTVPFSTNWESLTIAEAELIIANGHSIVTAQPWSEMLPSSRALRVDGRLPTESGYPFQNRLVIVATDGIETAVSDLVFHLQTTLNTPSRIHIVAVGDIMLDRTLGAKISAG
ncbi:MAG: hypothetical protein GY943_00285, partial [Chloroflexi bacterium]|nr:hypothetical protein [Chloroflexota bacterium]